MVSETDIGPCGLVVALKQLELHWLVYFVDER